MAAYLGVRYLSLFANGTLALIVALQVLRVSGEVITSPYSFVATTHSLHWNGLKPVFADIEPRYCNLNPEKIEAAITPRTTAIVPVHVYGNPCDVLSIQEIADRYNLKVVYDAAHAFGVNWNGQSILNFGDLSVLSFHATKVFNTFEGGAIVCHDEKTKKRIDFLRNFGFADEVTVVAPGINAKMNEVQAAFGLLQLKYIDGLIDRRKEIARVYRSALSGTSGIRLLDEPANTRSNYSYFPIFVEKKGVNDFRDVLYTKLKQYGIFARRYFYPLISEFPSYRGLASAGAKNLPVATQAARTVLCLPIYPDLPIEKVKEIAELVRGFTESQPDLHT